MPARLSISTDYSGENHQSPRKEAPSTTKPPVTPPVGGDATPKATKSSGPTKPITLADWDQKTPLEFPEDLEFQNHPAGRPVELGRGAWSAVYMAVSRIPTRTSLPTPPSSPASGSRVLAVKSPHRSDAIPVLQAEGLVLTRISLTPGSGSHVVPFHGYIGSSNSIVMSAVPQQLSTYIEDKATLARKNMSTKTMFDPVLGMSQWQDLAGKLIAGLSWLHNEAQVVHGDMKPHNILLRPCSTAEPGHGNFPFEPLFADFSSAHDLACPSTTGENGGTSMAALTPPFTAPEFLVLSSLASSDAVPTTASDVFSMAITLLTAATGDLLLYPGSNNMQRLAMAREGHRVLDFVRSGDNGCRVPRNGAVEQTIKPGITKDPAQRILSDAWLGLVRNLA
jgi:serine/threonine protein kinase